MTLFRATELIKYVDTAAQLVYLDAADDPGAGPLAQDFVLVFTAEDIELLGEVFWGAELKLEVVLLCVDQFQVLAEETFERVSSFQSVFFKNSRQRVQVAFKEILAIFEIFVEDCGSERCILRNILMSSQGTHQGLKCGNIF